MTSAANGSGRTGAARDEIELQAKLTVPALRDGYPSRRQVWQPARDSGATAVGVTAPVGYGKTALLAEWAHRDPRSVAWLSLDRDDDDPATLLALLAAAYGRAFPRQASLKRALRATGGHDADARGTVRITHALAHAPSPFLLLVDDVHHLRSSACQELLVGVLAVIPPGSQVVTASRDEQRHLAPMRATGATVEITAGELTLDAAGAARVFADAGVPLTRAQAVDVAARTEGWPAAVHLGAHIAHDVGGDSWEVTGDDRYIAAYLHREVFGRLDPATQRFLRRTAVLDRLEGPLCDAVLAESGSQARLRVLASANSFLVPLDRRHEGYRHHTLVREFLLAELRRHEPMLVEALHVRAADWFLDHGSPASAVEHLLVTAERERCARLVAELALPAFVEGRASTVQRWLTSLGDSAIRDQPLLAALAGWIAAEAGRPGEAERWAVFVAEVPVGPAADEPDARFTSTRSALRAMMGLSGPEQMLVDAELATRLERQWSAQRAVALCALGEARLAAGSLDEAEAALDQATTVGTETGSWWTVVVSRSELALLRMDDGRWEAAAADAADALATLERHPLEGYGVVVLPHAAAARLALHDADLPAAQRHLHAAAEALPASTYASPHLATRGRLQVARVQRALGDHVAARRLLDELDAIRRRRPQLGGLVEQVRELRELVRLDGDHGPDPAGLTPAELRLLPLLQTHLRLADIAEELYVTRNTVASEVSAIYRKLGVSSRGDAVRTAAALGLLGN